VGSSPFLGFYALGTRLCDLSNCDISLSELCRNPFKYKKSEKLKIPRNRPEKEDFPIKPV
jgi:hypothetical protein